MPSRAKCNTSIRVSACQVRLRRTRHASTYSSYFTVCSQSILWSLVKLLHLQFYTFAELPWNLGFLSRVTDPHHSMASGYDRALSGKFFSIKLLVSKLTFLKSSGTI